MRVSDHKDVRIALCTEMKAIEHLDLLVNVLRPDNLYSVVYLGIHAKAFPDQEIQGLFLC